MINREEKRRRRLGMQMGTIGPSKYLKPEGKKHLIHMQVWFLWNCFFSIYLTPKIAMHLSPAHSGFTLSSFFFLAYYVICCNGRKGLWNTYTFLQLEIITAWQKSPFTPNCRVLADFLKAIDWKWCSWGTAEEPWMETEESHFYVLQLGALLLAAWCFKRQIQKIDKKKQPDFLYVLLFVTISWHYWLLMSNNRLFLGKFRCQISGVDTLTPLLLM